MTLQNVYVGLFYDAKWNDITTDVYSRDPITITRGKADYTGAPNPTRITCTIGNRSQKYDPRNAQSPLYGKVGRNTPIMVGYNPIDEDFEDTTFAFTWGFAGTGTWARSSTQAHAGTWSFKSPTLTNGQQSSWQIDVPAGANSVSLWIWVSIGTGSFASVFTSEGRQWFTSGDRSRWELVTVDVGTSTYVLVNYQRNDSGGTDSVWVDDLRMIDARGTAEITSWRPNHSLNYNRALGLASPGDAWTTIEARGVLARIGVATDPIRSALYRATTTATVLPAAYWPVEDPDGSVQAVSGIGGGPLTPVTVVRYTLPDGTPLPPGGAPKFEQDAGVPGAAKLASFKDGGTLAATVPGIPNTGYAIDFVMRFSPGAGDGTTSVDIAAWRESGTYVHFTVNVTLGAVTVFHSNAADDLTLSFTGSATATVNVFDGTAHHFRYAVSQSGGNYLGQLYIDGTLLGTATNFVPPMAGTIGHPVSVEFNPGEDRGDYMPVALGHLTVWPTAAPPNMATPAFGNRGERAADRLLRFGVEQGWPVIVRSQTGDSMPMGPQGVDTMSNLIAEIERTEDGLVLEQRGAIGLLLRTRRSQRNQPARLAITAPTLDTILDAQPDEDNPTASNDVTAKNYDGTEARAVLASGTLSVQPPPAGVGRYPVTVQVNADPRGIDLAVLAGWWLNRGTVDQRRYPTVQVDADKHGLTASVAAVDPGDRITFDGLEPDLVDQRVTGITEQITFDGFRRLITFACEPYRLFDSAIYNNTSKRYDSRTSTLNAGYSTTATSMVVTFTDLRDQWSQTNAPYDWDIAGERVRVTAMGAVSGTGPWTQTATVTRSIDSIVKAQTAGTPVRMHAEQQARYAL